MLIKLLDDTWVNPALVESIQHNDGKVVIHFASSKEASCKIAPDGNALKAMDEAAALINGEIPNV